MTRASSVSDLSNVSLAASQIIHHLSRLVPGRMDRNAFFRILAQQLRLFFLYDRLCINVYDAEREFLSLLTAPDGTVVESLSNTRVARNTVAGLAIASRRPVVISDLSSQDFGGPNPLADVGLNATVALPLIVNREVIGTLHTSFVRQPENVVEILNLLLEVCPALAAFLFTLLAEERLDVSRSAQPLSDASGGYSLEDRLFETMDMAEIMSVVRKVCALNVPVLITGETGTGKSMLARYIHSHSLRRAADFVKVNCPSLAPTLFESEMFGHAKGAFTGASAKRIGRIEMAQEGTLFLDEIAELSSDMQSKLLQVLEEKAFERVGETLRMSVDIRLLSATNVELAEALADRRLRRDLFYRLSSVIVTMPPLRRRKNDIPLLLGHFIARCALQYGLQAPSLTPDVLDVLCGYRWPGNIRELRNVVNHILLRSMDGPVTARGVRDMLNAWEPASGAPAEDVEEHGVACMETSEPHMPTLEANERAHIERALRLTGGRLSGPRGAAALLAIPRSTLQHRMRKLGIRPS